MHSHGIQVELCWSAAVTARYASGICSYERLDISRVKGVTEAQKATLRALGVMERTRPAGIQQVP